MCRLISFLCSILGFVPRGVLLLECSFISHEFRAKNNKTVSKRQKNARKRYTIPLSGMFSYFLRGANHSGANLRKTILRFMHLAHCFALLSYAYSNLPQLRPISSANPVPSAAQHCPAGKALSSAGGFYPFHLPPLPASSSIISCFTSI